MRTMAKKSLGQHFLVNEQIADREITYANLKPEDVVLEIGPGHGILTRRLMHKVKQVIAVEIDDLLVKELSAWMQPNVLLIRGDVLQINFQSIPVFTKIVANLPFQISSPITFKLLTLTFDTAILMYQKDFAQRMIAESGSKHYSRLTVGVYYKADCQILENVPKSSFAPQPKVESCIVKLVPKKKPAFSVVNEEFFFWLTKALFTHRRKQIKNTIENALKVPTQELPFMTQRVEELTPEEIGELSDIIYTNLCRFKKSCQ